MINKIHFIAITILMSISILAVNSAAQTTFSINETQIENTEIKNNKPITPRANDDYFKTEITGGYSWMKANQGTIALDKDSSLHGFEASVTRNFKRYVGVKFSTGSNFYNESTNGGIETRNQSFYSFLGGVQFKDNRKSTRVKPFAHALAGVSYFRDVYKTSLGSGHTSINTQTAFTMAFGGGLDIRVSKKISVRPIQFDYFVNANTGLVPRSLVRLGAGINFHF